MATILLTITTTAPSWETVPPDLQSLLTRFIAHATTDELKAAELREQTIQKRKFSPWTGSIESLALFDYERRETIIYTIDKTTIEAEDGVTVYERTEAEILAAFWEGAIAYDRFVTFQGRRFVVPFLLERSAICRVRPTVNLLTSRYLQKQGFVQHVDLFDQVTYYGQLPRRPSLALLTAAYGLEVPSTVTCPVLVEISQLLALYEHWVTYGQQFDDVSLW